MVGFWLWLAIVCLRFNISVRHSKHGAVGTASRGWTYAGKHFISGAGGVGSCLPASRLMELLREERGLANA